MARQGIISEGTETEASEVSYDGFPLGDAWVHRNPVTTNATPLPFRSRRRDIYPISTDTGQTFIDYLVRQVNQAKEVICLSSYMIQESNLTQALLAASSRGLRVYVLTSGEEELARMDTEMDDVEKAKVEGYRQLLNSMAGRILIRTAPHFHAKFLLIDPHSGHGEGVMMTCNATIDAMTGRNFEVAVTLTQDETISFFAQFVRAFWQEAKHELLRPGELSDVHPTPESVSFGGVTHPATLRGCTTLRGRVEQLIASAQKELVATGWTFGSDSGVTAALEKALERGVTVRIFTRPVLGNTEALAALVAKGAHVFGHDRYHAKALIVDSHESLLMTSNFTQRGLGEGFETGIELDREESEALVGLVRSWEPLCEWELRPSLSLSDATNMIRKKIPGSKKLETVEVIDLFTKDFGVQSLVSLDEPVRHPPAESSSPNGPATTKLYKRGRFTSRTSLPILPAAAIPFPGAQEEFPHFRIPKGEHFVVVSSWEDVEKAKPLAAKWKARIVIRLTPPKDISASQGSGLDHSHNR